MKQLHFELSPEKVQLKELLNGRFLSLEMEAISNANPNENGSHFCLDGMNRAVNRGDFKNIPVLGFFKNGDFVSHEGQVSYDQETQDEYWDVSGGEQILGWTRDTDKVEVIKKDDLYWVKFSCVLCTRYCYKQAKRLISDVNKAVSVEVIVNEAEMRDDGVMDIVDFSIQGVTILGSRRGKPVKPGIKGANLKVLMGEQKEALAFEYDEYEKEANINDDGKEETPMNDEEKIVTEEETPAVVDPATEMFEDDEPEKDEKPEGEETPDEEKESCEDEEKCEEKDEEEKTSEEPAEEKESCEDEEKESCEDNEDECAKCEKCAQYEAENAELTAKIAQYESKISEMETAISEANAKIANFEAENTKLTQKLEGYSDYESIKTALDEANKKITERFCADLVASATEKMKNAEVDDADRNTILDKCKNGTYANEDEMVKDVAYAIYKCGNRNTRTRFESGINAHDTLDDNTRSNKNSTAAERIAARCRKI